MAYPGAISSFTNPNGTSLLTSPDHAALHTSINNDVTAIENVLGTNSGTSVLKNFISGNFPARINSSNVPQQLLSNGTFNNSVVGTPNITGGTITNGNFNNGTIGTPSIQQGTLLEPFIDTHSLGSAAWLGTVSGTTTLDLGTAQRLLFKFPNSAGSITLAVTNVVVNRPFMVEVLQGTAGLGTIGWMAGVNWMGPVGTVGTAANNRDLYGFMPIGTATFIGLTMGTGGL